MRKNKITVSVFLLMTLFLTISFPLQAKEDANLEKDGTEERDEEDNENNNTTEPNSPEVKKSPDNEPAESKTSEESQVPKENKKENTEKTEDLNENSSAQEIEQNSDSLEDASQTDDTDTFERDENFNSDSEVENEKSTNEFNQETPTETMQENNAQPRQGLIDVILLSNSSLDASYSEDNSQIILTYEASGALNLGLLSNTYIIFKLPPKITNVITEENLTVTYDFPGLNLGLSETVDNNVEENQVSIEFFSVASLSISGDYQVTLTIDLEELPPTETGEYPFMAEATAQLINLSLLSDENIATATLEAPQIPNAPVINEPIHTTDTQVTGTGEPNTTIHLQIGNEEYTGQVDDAGNFSVDIPEQEEGTEIQGSIVDRQGYESDVEIVTVTAPPDTTPPEFPDINPVYSNDTMVTGTGEPNTTVYLTIADEIYESTVDENGEYAVSIPEQDPDTVISSQLVDNAGNESEVTETTVIEATVSFNQVPDNLSFETTEIGSDIERIPRKNPNWSLEVIDTRGEGSPFRLTAEAEQPLTIEDGDHQLPNALVYVDGNNTSHSLTKGTVEVYNGRTGEDPTTPISWDDNQGPLIEMNTNDAYAGTYQTEITWTLIDGP